MENQINRKGLILAFGTNQIQPFPHSRAHAGQRQHSHHQRHRPSPAAPDHKFVLGFPQVCASERVCCY